MSKTFDEALESDDAEERRIGLRSLRPLPPALEVTGESLLRALGDPDWKVRKEAVLLAVDAARDPALLDVLVDSVADGNNVGLRNASLEVLEQLGNVAAERLWARWTTLPEAARKFYVEALGRTREPRMVSLLEAALGDPDANVAAAAVDALATVGGPEAEAALKLRLSGRDPFQRLAALDALNRIEATLTWQELSPLLDERLLRPIAVPALGRSGRIEAVRPLLASLAESHGVAFSACAVSLARLCQANDEAFEHVCAHLPSQGGRVRDALRKILFDASVEERRAAALLLVAARDFGALDGVIEILVNDALPPIGMRSLRQWGDALVEPMLTIAAQSSGARRAVALAAAADVGAATTNEALRQRVLGDLRAALGDSDEEVVLSAVRCMRVWATADDADALMLLADRASEAVARACASALERLAKQDRSSIQRALGARESGIPPSRPAFTSLRAMLDGEQASSYLQDALNDDDPAARRAAVEAVVPALGALGADLLALALADDNVDVQVAAVRALGLLRDAEGKLASADVLAVALESREAPVRAAAARAFGDGADTRAEAQLRLLTSDADTTVALAAFSALRVLGSTDLDDLVAAGLEHPEPEVVKEALRTAQRIDPVRAIQTLAQGLEHSAWDVRCVAVELLGAIDDVVARETLTHRLEREHDRMVRDAIQRVLKAKA